MKGKTYFYAHAFVLQKQVRNRYLTGTNWPPLGSEVKPFPTKSESRNRQLRVLLNTLILLVLSNSKDLTKIININTLNDVFYSKC